MLAALRALLDEQFNVSGAGIVVGAASCLIVVPAVQFVVRLRRTRAALPTFVREWFRFRKHFELLHLYEGRPASMILNVDS